MRTRKKDERRKVPHNATLSRRELEAINLAAQSRLPVDEDWIRRARAAREKIDEILSHMSNGQKARITIK